MLLAKSEKQPASVVLELFIAKNCIKTGGCLPCAFHCWLKIPIISTTCFSMRCSFIPSPFFPATSDVASHYQLATSQFSPGKDENILASRTPLPIFPSEQETVQLINVPSADQVILFPFIQEKIGNHQNVFYL